MFKRIALSFGLLIGIGAALPFTASAADEPVCQLAGVNDDGGYIDCPGVTGPARVTGVTYSAEVPRIYVDILVNDETPLVAEIWLNPTGSLYALVLYEGSDIVAAGVTDNFYSETDVTISYGATLEFEADCGDGWYSWCR